MDLVDKTIMVEICANCRVSYEALARKTGISSNAVKRRVDSLLKSGTISRFSVSLVPAMLGAEYFLALITTDGTEAIDPFVSRLGEHPAIGHVSLLASAGGGAYLVWGQYMGSTMLMELRAFLTAPDEVNNVELHTLVRKPSRKTELPRLHLRILSVLKTNPRMPLNDIAKELGLAPKTVRRGLREMMEDGAVSLTARPDMATGKLVNFYVRFEWDEKMKTMEEMLAWLDEQYPVELWDPTPTVSGPIFFSEFVVDNLHKAERIARQIRDAPFVKSTATLVSYSNQKFPYYAETKLDEMIRESET